MIRLLVCCCLSFLFISQASLFAQTDEATGQPAESVLSNQQVTQAEAAKPDTRPDNERPELGAILVPGTKGASVQSVYTNGPLHQQDFRSGDVLLSIDDVKMTTSNDVLEFLKGKKPGDLVQINRDRAGAIDKLSVKLMSRKRILEVSNIEGNPNANISRQYVGSGVAAAEAMQRMQTRLEKLEAEVKRLRAELESLRKE